MYYEDEKNLYHYSYRKSDGSEPVYEAHCTEVPTEPAKAPRRKHRVVGIVALALVCALLGGVTGAVISGGKLRRAAMQAGILPPQQAVIQVSSREVTEVKPVKVEGVKAPMTAPQIYDAAVGSVVSINVSLTTNVFGQQVESGASAGSGFIITKDGYIVTNYHVVEDGSNIKVTLYSGETYDAELIGGDKEYDIAVLKIAATDLPTVTMGDSEVLHVGETIYAIGNPLGELTFSMSQGIVSCVNRTINVDGTPFNMIQVDCSVNPGNSGGPLINAYGETVGIVSAKYSSYSTESVEGLGFAIPINDVVAMIEDIMTNGYITNKAYLGVTAGTLTESMAKQYRYNITEGVFIYSVEDGGAAQRAGLQMGDVITKIDGKDITSMSDLTAVKKAHSAGDTVTLTVYRAGETITVPLTFDATPETTEEPEEQQPDNYYNGDGGNGYYYFNPFDLFDNFFRGW